MFVLYYDFVSSFVDFTIITDADESNSPPKRLKDAVLALKTTPPLTDANNGNNIREGLKEMPNMCTTCEAEPVYQLAMDRFHGWSS